MILFFNRIVFMNIEMQKDLVIIIDQTNIVFMFIHHIKKFKTNFLSISTFLC